jgi:hypothetical protein
MRCDFAPTLMSSFSITTSEMCGGPRPESGVINGERARGDHVALRAAQERDSGERTMGVGLMVTPSAKKNNGSRTRAAEERGYEERTMGWS